MCLLTVFPPEQQPDLDALRSGTEINPDGHGFAIVAGDRIIVRHSTDAASLLETFARMRERLPEGPALFHSRLATHGRVTKANCHPFRLGGDRRTVLAHNGVMPVTVQPRGRDPRSDTRIAAEDYIPTAFGRLTNRRARRRLEGWMGRANKMALLTVNPAFRRSFYILNECAGIWDAGIWDAGIWDAGIWYSNTDYRPDRLDVLTWIPGGTWTGGPTTGGIGSGGISGTTRTEQSNGHGTRDWAHDDDRDVQGSCPYDPPCWRPHACVCLGDYTDGAGPVPATPTGSVPAPRTPSRRNTSDRSTGRRR